MGTDSERFDDWMRDRAWTAAFGLEPAQEIPPIKPGSPLGDFLMRTLAPVQPPAGLGLPSCPHGELVNEEDVTADTEPVFLDIDDPEPMWRCMPCALERSMNRVNDDVCRLCGRKARNFNNFSLHFRLNIMLCGNACEGCWRKTTEGAQPMDTNLGVRT